MKARGPQRARSLPPYREPVGSIGVRDLPRVMGALAMYIEQKFPGLAFAIVVTEFREGAGAAHISNCERDSLVALLREYCDELERRHPTEGS